MSWILRKLDSLAGGVLAAAGGMVTSQSLAFVQQYLQRLGGHLDEARLNLRIILENAEVPSAGPAPEAMRPIVETTQARLAHLQEAHDAIATADLWHRPFVFLNHADWAIARATADRFQPAIPIDLHSLVFTLGGVVLALILWEILKLPFSFGLPRSRHRRRIFQSGPGAPTS